jgi:poly(ADP-ribose) glycohydrolase
MDALLPVKREVGEGGETTYTWQGSVKYSLLALARGAFASQILSGEALFDCIRDLQLRSGLPHSRLARHASHGLTLFCDDLMSPADAQVFFRSTLPQIARLALNLPALLQSQSQHLAELGAKKDRPEMALRLLRKQHAGMVLLRQELVASLLACSFLCLFPSENRREEDLGMINFDRLFAGVYERGERNENKLRCILHYFDRVCNTMPQGSVSFERKVLPKKEVHDGAFWRSSQASLCPITLLEKGFIEYDGRECLQVDFANRLLGGGALADGCVQVSFLLFPPFS